MLQDDDSEYVAAVHLAALWALAYGVGKKEGSMVESDLVSRNRDASSGHSSTDAFLL